MAPYKCPECGNTRVTILFEVGDNYICGCYDCDYNWSEQKAEEEDA